MGRIDYLHDPDAPPANSVVPSVVAFVQNDAGEVLMIPGELFVREWFRPYEESEFGDVLAAFAGHR